VKVARVGAAIVVLMAASFTFGRATKAENHRAIPMTREGWAVNNESMTAIACCGRDADHAGGTSYLASPPHWRNTTGELRQWHPGDERPTCFNSTNTPFHVRIGVVDAQPGEGIGTEAIIWLECL